jgi:ferredoxin-type protein NapG
MSRRRSRRDLLTGWFDTVRSVAGRAGRAPEAMLRPPGALTPDDAYVEACTGCGDCLPVCPAQCIVLVDAAGGKKVAAIDPGVKPCTLCEDLPCIAACPDGALVDPGDRERVRIGIAKVDPKRCVTFRGQRCDRCYRICPFPDRAIMMIGTRPLVGSGACTGCGLCEYACPEEPKAIEIIPERELVPGLRVPKTEYEAG